MLRCTRLSCPKPLRWSIPFHVISLANRCHAVVRCRIQTEQLGRRGRKDDPLYRARRVLLADEERLDAAATERLWSLVELGDRGAEVAIAYRIKERLRDFYHTREPNEAHQLFEELQDHCLRPAMPPEIQRLGSRIRVWFDKICNYYLARVSNGSTLALNNLVKRIKRISVYRPSGVRWHLLSSMQESPIGASSDRSSRDEMSNPVRIRRAALYQAGIWGSMSARVGIMFYTSGI